MSAIKVEAICKNYTEDADEPVKRKTYQNVLDGLQDNLIRYDELILKLEDITNKFIPKDEMPKSDFVSGDNSGVFVDYLSLAVYLNAQLFCQNVRMSERILLLESISV